MGFCRLHAIFLPQDARPNSEFILLQVPSLLVSAGCCLSSTVTGVGEGSTGVAAATTGVGAWTVTTWGWGWATNCAGWATNGAG